MTNPRLVAAVGFALVAAASGALAWGLSQPVLGAVSATAGVLAAAVAALGTDLDRRPAERPPSPPADEATTDEPEAEAAPATDALPEAAGEPAQATVAATTEAGTTEAAAQEPSVASDAPAVEQAGELVDETTGMLDHRYFLVALERRVAASRRKLSPFSLVVLELRPEDPARHQVTEQSMRVLAAVCRAVLRDADTGCRIDECTVGLLLEDTPEAGAVWATERVRAGFFATTFRGDVKLAAGVAAYPAHALEADRLLGAARDAAAASRERDDESIQLAPPDAAAEGAGGQGEGGDAEE